MEITLAVDDPGNLADYALSRWMRRFLTDVAATGDAMRVVLARAEQQVIGLCLYRVEDRLLRSCGTYVEARWRRKGVGSQIWRHVLDDVTQDPRTYVSACEILTVSREGRAFVRRALAPKMRARHLRLIHG